MKSSEPQAHSKVNEPGLVSIAPVNNRTAMKCQKRHARWSNANYSLTKIDRLNLDFKSFVGRNNFKLGGEHVG